MVNMAAIPHALVMRSLQCRQNPSDLCSPSDARASTGGPKNLALAHQITDAPGQPRHSPAANLMQAAMSAAPSSQLTLPVVDWRQGPRDDRTGHRCRRGSRAAHRRTRREQNQGPAAAVQDQDARICRRSCAPAFHTRHSMYGVARDCPQHRAGHWPSAPPGTGPTRNCLPSGPRWDGAVRYMVNGGGGRVSDQPTVMISIMHRVDRVGAHVTRYPDPKAAVRGVVDRCRHHRAGRYARDDTRRARSCAWRCWRRTAQAATQVADADTADASRVSGPRPAHKRWTLSVVAGDAVARASSCRRPGLRAGLRAAGGGSSGAGDRPAGRVARTAGEGASCGSGRRFGLGSGHRGSARRAPGRMEGS
jgi:hypothetical protein